MKNFIAVTCVDNGASFPLLVALHTIGTVMPSSLGPGGGTVLTLAFGKNGKEEHLLKEEYATVLHLIKDAQKGRPLFPYHA